jgi:UDP-hydrolysing UDP-N-acetyl-D-glucosamine 2-epimerase
MSLEELREKFGLYFNQPPLLVTFHPTTLEYEDTELQVSELLAALETFDVPVVFTLPNADTGSRIIIKKIEEFVATRSSAELVGNLGSHAYFSLMSQALAMVGNSSSGIIEAPSFRLPVVNIGSRQEGRVRAANVIDVSYDRADIVEGIATAIKPDFKAKLSSEKNPYGDGTASVRVLRKLKEVELSNELVIKRFLDFESRHFQRFQQEDKL